MEHVGFTLIALWEGPVIVLTIDLGTPSWLVVVLAVLGVVLGEPGPAPARGSSMGAALNSAGNGR